MNPSTDVGDLTLPDPDNLPHQPERIILHWTAGRHVSTTEEARHYHLLIEHLKGKPATPEDDALRFRFGVPIERNLQDLRGVPPAHHDFKAGYAAHTRHFNSGSIGVALCGMRGAKDFRPSGSVDPGDSPITRLQIRGLVSLCSTLCTVYGLSPTEDEVFLHYEAETLHGVDQLPKGDEVWKWNVTWIPGKNFGRDEAGPWIREQIARDLQNEQLDPILDRPREGEDARSVVKEQVG